MQSLSKELVKRWLQSDDVDQEELMVVSEAVEYLSKRLYNDYEPSQFDLFNDRLDRWLQNMDDDQDRRVLYRLLGHLFFVGRQEFESLCRAVFRGPITRWIIDGVAINFDDPDADRKFMQAVDRTWFCPITDSMRINAFLKVNNLDGKQYRPDWRSLARFGDPEKIKAYTAAAGIDRLALIEDFVGSGTQMHRALSFAARLNPDMPVIGCPLVVCPEGLNKGHKLSTEFDNLQFEPVLALPPAVFVKFTPQPGELPLFPLARELIRRVAQRLALPSGESTHGFEAIGALVVLYSNCPNNTLPIIHHSTDRWTALFPRIRRK